MNVYQVSVEPKPVTGAGLSNSVSCGRTFTVVTDSLQDAMSIARGHVGTAEQITGIYVVSTDAIVDYSHLNSGNN